MHAVSSPNRCTDGLSMVVLIDLKFLLSTKLKKKFKIRTRLRLWDLK